MKHVNHFRGGSQLLTFNSKLNIERVKSDRGCE